MGRGNIRSEVYILQWVIRARKSVASSRGDLLSLVTAEAAASLAHHRSLWKAKHQCAQKNLKDVFFSAHQYLGQASSKEVDFLGASLPVLCRRHPQGWP